MRKQTKFFVTVIGDIWRYLAIFVDDCRWLTISLGVLYLKQYVHCGLKKYNKNWKQKLYKLLSQDVIYLSKYMYMFRYEIY